MMNVFAWLYLRGKSSTKIWAGVDTKIYLFSLQILYKSIYFGQYWSQWFYIMSHSLLHWQWPIKTFPISHTFVNCSNPREQIDLCFRKKKKHLSSWLQLRAEQLLSSSSHPSMLYSDITCREQLTRFPVTVTSESQRKGVCAPAAPVAWIPLE